MVAAIWHFFLIDPNEPGSAIGTGVVLLASFAIIAAIVRHRVISTMLKKQMEVENARSRAILEAGFDGTADVESGRLVRVTAGFAAALGAEVQALEGQDLASAFPIKVSAGRAQQDAVPFLDATGACATCRF